MFRAEGLRCILSELNNRSFGPTISSTSFQELNESASVIGPTLTSGGEGFVVGCGRRFVAVIDVNDRVIDVCNGASLSIRRRFVGFIRLEVTQIRNANVTRTAASTDMGRTSHIDSIYITKMTANRGRD